MIQWHTNEFWLDQFRAFFHQKEFGEALPTVLPAHGCREGWVQAEAFRYFRAQGLPFYVNTLALEKAAGNRYCKADFSAHSPDDEDAEPLFAGELKLLGTRWYYDKNLTGGPIRELARRAKEGEPILFRDDERTRELGSLGVLGDYFRLNRFRSAGPCAKLLVLMIEGPDVPPEDLSNLGHLLLHVEFEHEAEELLRTRDVLVRAWALS